MTPLLTFLGAMAALAVAVWAATEFVAAIEDNHLERCASEARRRYPHPVTAVGFPYPDERTGRVVRPPTPPSGRAAGPITAD